MEIGTARLLIWQNPPKEKRIDNGEGSGGCSNQRDIRAVSGTIRTTMAREREREQSKHSGLLDRDIKR